ncbi:MAG: glycosyltransferase [Planctomycetes bacterium]|nr:glycosyltransferase [Planctomycetota bacterium]
MRTIANVVEHLHREFDFRIITRDRDLGDAEPFATVPIDRWTETGSAKVRYVSPPRLAARRLARLFRRTPHHVLYLNSVFSPRLTIAPLVLRQLGRIERTPAVLAPRGELAPSALSRHPRRKQAWLVAARRGGLFRELFWQASSSFEAGDIGRTFGNNVSIVVAPDLPPRLCGTPAPSPSEKRPGRLRIIFLSRVHPVKNLDGAIDMLAGLDGEIEFNVYGPAEDGAYSEFCRDRLARLPANVRAGWHGPLDPSDVPAALAAHDVLLFPTRGENFGHVILEALAAGRPVLVSDRTPWRNLAARGAGWDLPLNDAAAFHRVLERLTAMDRPEHERLCRAAAAHADRFCRDTSVIDRTRQLFHRALRATGRGCRSAA